jgi:hypothetical protein
MLADENVYMDLGFWREPERPKEEVCVQELWCSASLRALPGS